MNKLFFFLGFDKVLFMIGDYIIFIILSKYQSYFDCQSNHVDK